MTRTAACTGKVMITRIGEGRTLTEQGSPGRELFVLLDDVLRAEPTGSGWGNRARSPNAHTSSDERSVLIPDHHYVWVGRGT